ncbi:hypothetical protein ZIOFF_060278 [Zingiber officinale]|uniref:Ubiquitin-like protease family profile domain-containing protein n=1 Tax=Zingiber officinale TaxID=94328 RepID=A0A8J5F8D2_ZINOF|nr:hypothetical protein ZIOFF_060278 [Zingiber officinale]
MDLVAEERFSIEDGTDDDGNILFVSGRNGYDYKAIFVPIHKEIHLCLSVIHVKEKKFQYLDSVGGMDKTLLRVLSVVLHGIGDQMAELKGE